MNHRHKYDVLLPQLIDERRQGLHGSGPQFWSRFQTSNKWMYDTRGKLRKIKNIRQPFDCLQGLLTYFYRGKKQKFSLITQTCQYVAHVLNPEILFTFLTLLITFKGALIGLENTQEQQTFKQTPSYVGVLHYILTYL